jgi:hypothetical protein
MILDWNYFLKRQTSLNNFSVLHSFWKQLVRVPRKIHLISAFSDTKSHI